MDRDDLRSIQAPLKERYAEEPETALVTLTASGSLAIRLDFDLDTDATEEELETLLKLTERYCVVFQTLSTPPELSATLATSS